MAMPFHSSATGGVESAEIETSTGNDRPTRPSPSLDLLSVPAPRQNWNLIV